MNAIESASYELAAAQQELANATQNTNAASATLTGLEQRIAEKQMALDVIKARRLETRQELDSDAPTVALLALDIQGLQELATSARNAHSAAVQAEIQAQNAEAHCQKAYNRAVAGQQAAALLERLHEMENKLMAGISELHELRKVENQTNFVHGQTLYRFSQRLERFQSQGVLLAA
jgi:chromosome segregation ATPase